MDDVIACEIVDKLDLIILMVGGLLLIILGVIFSDKS